jgi:hypothetical protein
MKKTLKTIAKYVRADSTLMWNHRLVLSGASVKDWVAENGNRVRCTIGDQATFSAPLLHDGDGGFFITLNQSRLKKMNWEEGQPVTLQIESDDSPYGTEVSDAFLACLDDDEEASALFHALTPGKQRTLIHWVDQVKSSEIRIRRALVVMEHLKEVGGKLDFKRLNARMKEMNAAYKRG